MRGARECSLVVLVSRCARLEQCAAGGLWRWGAVVWERWIGDPSEDADRLLYYGVVVWWCPGIASVGEGAAGAVVCDQGSGGLDNNNNTQEDTARQQVMEERNRATARQRAGAGRGASFLNPLFGLA